MNSSKKYILYAYVKPYEIKLCLVFPIDFKIRFIQEYVEDTMRNFRTRFKVGRIEHKKTSSILLPDFKIGDVLEDKDEIIVYSIEYGLTKTNLHDKKSIEDIDKLFIAKKTKRESRGMSRKISTDKNYKKENNKSLNEKNENSVLEEENENEENSEDNETINNNNNKQKKDDNDNDSDETPEKNNNNKKRKDKNNDKNDNSSDSGDDKSEDLNL
jgi:hypothetical protein